ncbi:MAG TPA: TonB-dependent receptor [Blastocatellia bacterium]|nr:TonB-dependent receptor [Blastocatellia bacterium]
MKYSVSSLFALLLLIAVAVVAPAQTPTGALRGSVTDPAKAIISDAVVTVKNKQTGAERAVSSKSSGEFFINSLLPGEYEVKVVARGFKSHISSVTIQVGDTSTLEVALEVGDASETVVISGDSTALVNPADYKVDGVITRRKIDGLPLNGRNFLQLASLEPGVRVSVGQPGNANNLFNVSIGGGNSALTRLTVDGGNIVDPVTGSAAQNYSVDTIQEFQISSFNFDLKTGVTSVGAVNIVSRTGGNEYHGSGFGYFRDHNMGAYPVLQRIPNNPDPFFRRLQAGFALGGPIIKNKLAFFNNFERLNQTSAVATIHPESPIFSQFDTVSSSPYRGYLYNVRLDYTLNSKHSTFLRYASDNNRAFAPVENNTLPSDWRVNKNDVYQAQAGWTYSINPSLINQLSFNYQYIGNRSLIPTAADCPGCLGLGGAQIRVNNIPSFRIGNNIQAPQDRHLFRYETTDNLTWNKGAHIVETGGTWEPGYGQGSWKFVDPGIVVTHDPNDVIAVNGAIDQIAAMLPPALGFGLIAPRLKLPLPAAFTTPGATVTMNDILGLPVAFVTRGLGDGAQPPPFNSSTARHAQRFRFYGQDTWRVRPGLTLKYGLSYLYEDNLWNHDLQKSSLFAGTPLYSTAGANPKDKNNFAPALGFAWNVKNDNKTVIRGGFSMAYDTSLYVNRLTERALLGPAGNGRVVLSGDFFQNTFSFLSPTDQATLNAILGALRQFGAGAQATQIAQLVAITNPAVGAQLNTATLQVLPTKLTTGQALQILAQQGAAIQGQLNQAGAAGVIGEDVFKAATGNSVLIDPNIKLPYSESFSIGVQRELPWNMAINADFVFRRYLHSFFQRDRGLFNRAASMGGPTVPACVGAQATDPTVRCLNGPFEVLEGSGREDYKGLLLKLERRFTSRYQFTASYAYSRTRGFNYDLDLTNPFAFSGFGSSDRPHIFSFSGVADLPLGFRAGMIVSLESGAPMTVRIPGVTALNSDLNGDGTSNDLLPGTGFNTVNRDISASDLRRLVDQYNSQFAGKPAPRGTAQKPAFFPTLALPSNFDLSDSFQSTEVRLSKEFNIVAERLKLELTGELFNVFNTSNKLGFRGDLDSGFGQATAKASPTFGLGGPRVFQFGGRIKF